MSSFYPPIGAAIGGVVGIVAANTIGLTEPVSFALLVLGGIVGGVAWIVSPLPNGTTVMGS